MANKNKSNSGNKGEQTVKRTIVHCITGEEHKIKVPKKTPYEVTKDLGGFTVEVIANKEGEVKENVSYAFTEVNSGVRHKVMIPNKLPVDAFRDLDDGHTVRIRADEETGVIIEDDTILSRLNSAQPARPSQQSGFDNAFGLQSMPMGVGAIARRLGID